MGTMVAANQGGSITDIGLYCKNITKITALIMEAQQMAGEDYKRFKAEFMAEVKGTYPLAVRFINNVLLVMDMCLLEE